MTVVIRRARSSDLDWIVPLSRRLHEFGPPPTRPLDVMDRAVAQGLDRAVTDQIPDTVVLVAEDEEPLGFVHVHDATDYFTRERHGHVSDLVVSAAAEGRGVGRALMAAAEGWCRDRDWRLLTLNVFPANRRALELYDRLGFEPDTMKLLKALR